MQPVKKFCTETNRGICATPLALLAFWNNNQGGGKSRFYSFQQQERSFSLCSLSPAFSHFFSYFCTHANPYKNNQ